MLDKDIARLNIKADGYCLMSAACLVTLNLKIGYKVKLYTAYAPAPGGLDRPQYIMRFDFN